MASHIIGDSKEKKKRKRKKKKPTIEQLTTRLENDYIMKISKSGVRSVYSEILSFLVETTLLPRDVCYLILSMYVTLPVPKWHRWILSVSSTGNYNVSFRLSSYAWMGGYNKNKRYNRKENYLATAKLISPSKSKLSLKYAMEIVLLENVDFIKSILEIRERGIQMNLKINDTYRMDFHKSAKAEIFDYDDVVIDSSGSCPVIYCNMWKSPSD